jgi:hypothetical protein
MSNKSGGFSGFNDSSAGAPVVPTASPFGGPVQPPPLPRVPTGQVPTVPAVQSNGRQLSADLAGKKPVITQDLQMAAMSLGLTEPACLTPQLATQVLVW